MQFKLGGTTVRIRATLIAVLLLFSVFGKSRLLLPALLSSVLHECGHFIALKRCKAQVDSFTLGAAGAQIVRTGKALSYRQDILISLSGPLVNLLLFCILHGIFALRQTEPFLDFARINLILGAVNLCPVYSLDGGNVLYALLASKTDSRKAAFLLTVISFLTVIPLCILGFAAILGDYRNFQLLVVSLLLLSAILMKK